MDHPCKTWEGPALSKNVERALEVCDGRGTVTTREPWRGLSGTLRRRSIPRLLQNEDGA
jgi:hypothetical protein